MYLRGIHADATVPMLRQLIRDNPLGILTTAIRSKSYPLIQSSHIPFILDVKDDDDESELGILRGHLARQNPQSKAMMDAAQESPSQKFLEEEVMVLFSAAAHHYVTPKFYTETKPSTGKVVPTWNYAAAQAYGKARIFYDSTAEETGSFLSKQISDLSKHAETSVMGYSGEGSRPGPWSVSDAPEPYIKLMQKNIIGIEITIERLEGKFKMSQEMRQGDRDGVIQGFDNLGSEVGSQMAEMVRERAKLKSAREG
ncbi:transcriptional protein [Purpureocillium lavendulum]|uniref:Transcriptional protein n=1 Tax=Purpureocillium lavendulum TaxID=1247861 RepID=A0AB34FMJ9_9HYPO|nr:transcriptional protein [Purpureocillium lavendulum]